MRFRDLRKSLGRDWSANPEGWDDLFSPRQRDWFVACQTWLTDDCPEPDRAAARGLVELLTGVQNGMALLHLEIAELSRGAGSSLALAGGLRKSAEEHRLPLGLIRDLVEELKTGDLRKAIQRQIVSLLLVDSRGESTVADLVIELIEVDNAAEDRPEPELYAIPALAFLGRDKAFDAALAAALAWVRKVFPSQLTWHLGRAVPWTFRWSIHLRPEGLVDQSLQGPSAGAAFALAMSKLAADADPLACSTSRQLWMLDLGGVAVSATVTGDGRIGPVGADWSKLTAAAAAFPRIHTVVMAADQPLGIPGLVKDSRNPMVLREPGCDLHILMARSFEEAVRLLAVHFSTRWRIRCELPPRDPDFVGRQQLMKKLADFVEEARSGYLLLVGANGTGKSAFLKEFMRRQSALPSAVPICHFIDSQRQWTTTPAGIADCLSAQISRKHGVVEQLEHVRYSNPSEKLQSLLEQLSGRRTVTDRAEVLFVDGADMAETSADQPLIPWILPPLPPGVVCVVSSSDKRLPWIRSWDQVETWEFSKYTNDSEDIGEYLRRHNKHLSSAMVHSIVNGSPVFETVKTLLRRLNDPEVDDKERARLLTHVGPWLAPIERLVKEDLERRAMQALAAGIDERSFWLILGKIVLAMEPLGESVLRALGLWEKTGEQRHRVLSAGSIGLGAQREGATDVPFVFDHPAYRREICDHLEAHAQRDINQKWATACGEWRGLESGARVYALCHGMSHHVAAQDWDGFTKALWDFDFILERAQRFGFAGVYEDLKSALWDSSFPEGWLPYFSDLAIHLQLNWHKIDGRSGDFERAKQAWTLTVGLGGYMGLKPRPSWCR